MSPPRIVWSPPMLAVLQARRRDGVPIYWCADEIGVSYAVAVMKCRELGIADRRNRGRIKGERMGAKGNRHHG